MSVDAKDDVPTGQLPVVVEQATPGPAHSAGPARLGTPPFGGGGGGKFLQYPTFYLSLLHI